MLGIYGGTFDPIHYGHLRPALDVQQALGLEQMRFMPLGVAVHRAQPAASSAQRLAMLEAALQGQAGFVLDDREILRQGQSYTLLSLQELKREWPEQPLCLCIGSDAFLEFLSWHKPMEVLTLAHLVVTQRPGADIPREGELGQLVAERQTRHRDDLLGAQAGHIWFQNVTQLDISSTGIRALLARDQSPRYLLPDAVLDIIQQESLYR